MKNWPGHKPEKS